jgi:hypothetical protein
MVGTLESPRSGTVGRRAGRQRPAGVVSPRRPIDRVAGGLGSLARYIDHDLRLYRIRRWAGEHPPVLDRERQAGRRRTQPAHRRWIHRPTPRLHQEKGRAGVSMSQIVSRRTSLRPTSPHRDASGPVGCRVASVVLFTILYNDPRRLSRAVAIFLGRPVTGHQPSVIGHRSSVISHHRPSVISDPGVSPRPDEADARAFSTDLTRVLDPFGAAKYHAGDHRTTRGRRPLAREGPAMRWKRPIVWLGRFRARLAQPWLRLRAGPRGNSRRRPRHESTA